MGWSQVTHATAVAEETEPERLDTSTRDCTSLFGGRLLIQFRFDRLGRFNRINFFHLGGELDYESCAAFRAVETFDLAAMFLENPVANAQAQPGAFAYRLGGKKRIENLLRIFYSRPGVGELHDNLRVVLPRANHQLSAAHLFQSVHRIADQVEENLQDLIGIPSHHRQVHRGVRLDIDVPPSQVQIAQMQSGRNHLIYFQERLLAGNAPRKTQQARHQSFYSAGKRADLFGHHTLPVTQRNIVQEQVGIPQNPRERIVYFVRRTRR